VSTIRIVGRVDESHQLTATVPTAVPAGTVELVLIVPERSVDEVDAVWEKGIAAEWHDDLADARQDIYSLTDGEPADEAR